MRIERILSEETRYRSAVRAPEDPVEFAENVLGLHLWSRQREILRAFRETRCVSVASCHDVGKTFTSAIAVLWWMFYYWPSYAITTAPSAPQVGLLWKELRNLWHRLPPEYQACGELTLERIRFYFPGTTTWDPKHEAYGRAANDQGRLQGEHAQNLLVVADEAAECQGWVFDAYDTFKPAARLYIGNPTVSGNDFHATFTGAKPGYTSVQISAEDTPNWTGEEVAEIVTELLIDQAMADDIARKWGRESGYYKARVLGQFPDESEQEVIAPRLWTHRAKERGWSWVAPGRDPLVRIGVDVAHLGSDCTCVATFIESTLVDLEAFPGETRTQENCSIIRKKVEAMRAYGFPSISVRIDRTGVGAGVADLMEEESTGDVEYTGVSFGQAALDSEVFVCARDEWYFMLRNSLRPDSSEPPITIACNGEALAKLTEQLANIRWAMNERAKFQVESKKKLKERGMPSPDEADAVVLALAPVEEASVFMQGLWS